MSTRSRLLIVAALAAAAPSMVLAQSSPFDVFSQQCGSGELQAGADLYVYARNGSVSRCYSVSGLFEPAVGTLRAQAHSLSLGGFGSLDIVGAANADPFINFGATTTSFLPGTTTYTFLFGTPIVLGPYNTATSSASVTVNSGGSVANSATYPAYLSGYGVLGVATTNLGADAGTTACAGGSTCNYASGTITFASQTFDGMQALLTYDQTGLGSVAAWTGNVTLSYVATTTTTPEPATIVLVGIGLAVLATTVRRRRS